MTYIKELMCKSIYETDFVLQPVFAGLELATPADLNNDSGRTFILCKETVS